MSEKDTIIGYSMGEGNINLLYKQSLEKGGMEKMEGEEENTNITELENGVTEVTEATETVVETESNPENEVVETSVGEGEATGETMFTEKDILEKFDNICSSMEELVIMAKEGLEHRNEIINKALESGVHSMGNSFNKDIFAKTFSNMNTKDIEQMGKAWEEQADAKFVKEKISKQDFSNNEKEELKRIGLTQFKTSNY